MIQSALLAELGIVHGYSTRTQQREAFIQSLRVKRGDLIMGEQVHGAQVASVREGDKGNVLSGIDGLVATGTRIALGVTFADCVPILAVDPGARVIGTAHAGWKGTLGGIGEKLVSAMKTAGADINHIYVSIGPHIGMCCYNVLEDRAQAFRKQFGDDERIAAYIQGQWHLDIGFANYQTLLGTGILKDHIDAPVACTSCQIAVFHSFRKDPKDAFGVQWGIISL